MKVVIFSFGKLKISGMRDLADHYYRLINSFTSIEEIELKPLPVAEKSAASRHEIQKKEGTLLLEKIKNHLGTRAPFYLLDEIGKSLTTQQWAQQILRWESQGNAQLGICVGSSLGFSREVKEKAQKPLLSLGPQTLAHGLARVVLLEQLYRAWSVTRSHPYHNEGQ